METPALTQGSTKKTEYDIETKAMAVGFRLQGDSYHKISHLMKIPRSTIRDFISKAEETGSVKNKTRCGAPKKLKLEDKDMLKHDVLENRKSCTMSLKDITSQFNDKLTTEVSQRIVW